MEQAIKASSENLLVYLHRVVQYGRQLAVLRSVLSEELKMMTRKKGNWKGK